MSGYGKRFGLLPFALMGAAVLLGPTQARADDITGSGAATLTQISASDSWGFADAELKAQAVIREKDGKSRTVRFSAQSRYYDGTLTKSLVRFLAPPDLNGVKFLQIQKRDTDDERYIYLPELKRVRRVSGKLRAGSFMTTDFAFADLDRRELRFAEATALPDEKLGDTVCNRLTVKPTSSDAQYSRMEVWARKDNHMILKSLMYDLKGNHSKTFTVEESKQVQGRWFVTRSRMESHSAQRATTLVLEQITPRKDIPDNLFDSRRLEQE
jgi:hypothetical protein